MMRHAALLCAFVLPLLGAWGLEAELGNTTHAAVVGGHARVADAAALAVAGFVLCVAHGKERRRRQPRG